MHNFVNNHQLIQYIVLRQHCSLAREIKNLLPVLLQLKIHSISKRFAFLFVFIENILKKVGVSIFIFTKIKSITNIHFNDNVFLIFVRFWTMKRRYLLLRCGDFLYTKLKRRKQDQLSSIVLSPIKLQQYRFVLIVLYDLPVFGLVMSLARAITLSQNIFNKVKRQVLKL